MGDVKSVGDGPDVGICIVARTVGRIVGAAIGR
jgi:hypothetical protein